jgi:hypothetical protein
MNKGKGTGCAGTTRNPELHWTRLPVIINEIRIGIKNNAVDGSTIDEK